jgi:hypothetical protein
LITCSRRERRGRQRPPTGGARVGADGADANVRRREGARGQSPAPAAAGAAINKIVNTYSNNFNITKSVCEDKLSDTDKNIIQGDLYLSNDIDLEQLKKTHIMLKDNKD